MRVVRVVVEPEPLVVVQRVPHLQDDEAEPQHGGVLPQQPVRQQQHGDGPRELHGQVQRVEHEVRREAGAPAAVVHHVQPRQQRPLVQQPVGEGEGQLGEGQVEQHRGERREGPLGEVGEEEAGAGERRGEGDGVLDDEEGGEAGGEEVEEHGAEDGGVGEAVGAQAAGVVGGAVGDEAVQQHVERAEADVQQQAGEAEGKPEVDADQQHEADVQREGQASVGSQGSRCLDIANNPKFFK